MNIAVKLWRKPARIDFHTSIMHFVGEFSRNKKWCYKIMVDMKAWLNI